MFKSIVHDANLSLNGKAKSAIEGYGYSGDSYHEALKELGSSDYVTATSSNEHFSASHRNRDSVLLQVVPVTLCGPKGP